MANVAEDFSAFGVQDPDEMQQGLDNQYAQEALRTNAGGRNSLQIKQGMDQAFGNPAINKQRELQTRLKAIISDADANSDPDEDPLGHSLRIAKAAATGLVDLNPQAALQATQQAVKLQQARTQQNYLLAETRRQNQESDAGEASAALNKKLGTIVFAKQGEPDAKGLPTGLKAVATLDPSDPDYATKALQIMNDAKKGGEQVIPMSGKDFFNSKDSNAVIRGQYALAAAQEATKRALETAAAKAQAGQMTGREYMMTSRIVSAADLGSAALANIVELPVGSNTGVFGIGAAPGHSIVTSVGDTLRNKLSDRDVQAYNTSIAGLTRNLATIEASGVNMTGAFTESMGSVVFRAGDDELTALRKLAETRQIIEKGTKSTLNNPRLPPAVRDEIEQSLQAAATAVPFTVHDVTELAKQQAGGKKVSINDILTQRGLKNAPATAGGSLVEGATGKDKTGRPWTVKAGKRIYD